MKLAVNKRGLHEYEILESFDCGIVLEGHEVKSAKAGQVSLKGSYVKVVSGEVFLINAMISRYKPAGVDASYDPTHTRKLLLRKAEIQRLIGKTAEKGLTLIPTSLYTKGQLVKLKIGLARKKTQRDRREDVKRRDAKRSIMRNMKRK